MITKEDIEFSKLSYTNKDFASLYPDLLDLAKQLTNLWDPSASNESDPGVVLLKEGAFIADHNNYNIDKNTLECFLPSATQETSVRNLVEMNGYTPRYYISGVGTLNFEYRIPDDATEGTPTTLEIPPFTLKVTNEDGSVTYTQGPETLIINATNLPKKVAPDEKYKKVKFYEGTLNTLTVNGIDTITLDNIDDNNRLYFPVRQVAENGIFISNVLPGGTKNYDFWEQTPYLLTKPIGTKVYKLDYDSSLGLPYIEFPSDIANLIESGLTVQYIVSSGENGNIQANQLCKISSPANLLYQSTSSEVKVPTTYISLSNPSSVLNGKNPETIDEMYQSFKKIVHTFETLVTCKDFTDAIYMMSDPDTKTRYIGNDLVTDIKTDYNNSIRVVSYDEYGSFVKNIALSNGLGRLKFCETKPSEDEVQIGDMCIENGKIIWYTQNKDDRDSEGNLKPHWEELDQISYDDFVRASEAITPFDICVYLLKAFSMADYNQYFPWIAHTKSFEPVLNDTTGKEIIQKIKDGLEEKKCLNHQFKLPESGDIICFKNYVPLYITVIPYSKVTIQERDAIYDNIYRALSINFNSGMVDFGEELDYDTVYNVIVNADDRIKSIRLEDFDYETWALVMGHLEVDNSEEAKSRDFTTYKLFDDPRVGNYLFIDLVAKNALAGRLCVFDIDDNFDYQYGQVEVEEYHNIKTITSEVQIPVDELMYIEGDGSEVSSEGYTPADIKDAYYYLCENEYIMIAWPNYYTDITYPTYVYYRFESPDSETNIPENQEYELKAGESITLVWTQNGNTQRKTYGPKQVIKPNFNLKVTPDTAYYTKTGSDGREHPFDILTTNQQIEHKVLLKTTLKDKATPVYWITQGNRRLFTKTEIDSEGNKTVIETNEDMLNSGEYFIYSNKQMDGMVIFGAGTKLYKDVKDDNDWSGVAEATIDDINDEGYNANISWRQFDFTGAPFYIQEMNLLTLGVGDAIHIDFDTSSISDYIGNDWEDFTGVVKYKVNVDSKDETEGLIDNNVKMNIRSRLDMTSDKDHEQELLRNQRIIVELEDGTKKVIKNNYTGDYELISDKDRLYYQANTDVDILGDTTTEVSDLQDYLANFNLDIRSFKKTEPVIKEVGTDNSGTIITDDGNLYITMDYNNAEVLVPFSYISNFNTLDTVKKEYIFPLYIDDSKIGKEDFVEIDATIEGELTSTVGSVTKMYLEHYGREDMDEYDDPTTKKTIKFTSGGLHLLRLVVEGTWGGGSGTQQENEDVSVTGDLTFKITWNTPVAVAEYITLMQFKIIGGLNKDLAGTKATFTLDQVMDRINELMANSNDSDAIPYLTYIPENSMALQNDDLADARTMWDVNNVANPFTIAQIDLYAMFNQTDKNDKRVGTIDIVKSMKDYRE